jgi:hypothetical protein
VPKFKLGDTKQLVLLGDASNFGEKATASSDSGGAPYGRYLYGIVARTAKIACISKKEIAPSC